MPKFSNKGGGNRVFGQAMAKKGGSSRYQKQFGGSKRPDNNQGPTEAEAKAAEAAARKRARQEQGEVIDAKFGYHRLEDQHLEAGAEPVARRGWIFQMLPTTVSYDGKVFWRLRWFRTF
jgi:hypothetical protein